MDLRNVVDNFMAFRQRVAAAVDATWTIMQQVNCCVVYGGHSSVNCSRSLLVELSELQWTITRACILFLLIASCPYQL